MPNRSEPLTRGQIVDAALEIADREGLEQLSMRRVGRKLGVEAMSLYNHVADKNDLLGRLLERVLEQIELPEPGAEWRAAMRMRATSAREVFARHSWAIRLLESRSENSSPRRLAYFDVVLGALVAAGFENQLAMRAFATLDAYVFGWILQQSSLAFHDDASLRQVGGDLLVQMADRYPHLTAVTTEVMGSGYDHDAEFAWGLELILDALAARAGFGRLRASSESAAAEGPDSPSPPGLDSR